MSNHRIFTAFIGVLLTLLTIFSLTAVLADADDFNLARGKANNVSSTLIMPGCNYEADNALDGDLDTSWYADPAQSTAFYEVDFADVYEIDSVKIYWGIYDYATDFTVSGKTQADGEWTVLVPETLTNTLYQAHYVTEIALSEQLSALRIDCNGKNDWSYEIFEIEAYAPVSPTTTSAPATQGETTVPQSTQEATTQAPEGEPYAVSRTENHAYIEYEWVRKAQTDEFINAKLDALEENSIRYLFCDIGVYYIEENPPRSGEYRLTKNIKYAGLAHWIREAHERGMLVSACVNFELGDGVFANATQSVTFGTRVKNQIVTLSRTLLATGLTFEGQTYYCDGIHLDAEPFDALYQNYYMTLVTAISRTVHQNDKMFSLYTPAKNGAWTNNYLRRIIALVDMINPALYDTNGPEYWGGFNDGVTQTAEEYRRLCKVTCMWYSNNIEQSSNPACLLSPTLPVYEDKSGDVNIQVGFPVEDELIVYYHLNYNPETGEELESLENAIAGVNEAANAGAHVYSAGVFYWPAFTGESGAYRTSINPYYNSADDRADWQNDWLLA